MLLKVIFLNLFVTIPPREFSFTTIFRAPRAAGNEYVSLAIFFKSAIV